MRRRNVKNAHERLISHEGLVILEPINNFGNWHKVFNNNNPIHLEIGMGKGDFIIELAKRNQNINYIGLEKFESVILQAAIKAADLNLNNLKLICFDANDLPKIFSEHEINKIYLNFSDPWPKARHEKRRLTYVSFLEMYKTICKQPVEIEFKTDNLGLFAYSLKSFNQNHWSFIELSLDLHNEQTDIIMTEYEKKFNALGHPICYLKTRYEDK